ncbi:hypothetical protein [Methylocystis sp. SC2]|uniref:hypothetical protein n=1 Tax=Methylocystis sp. (strain SC2) TaxID=187303 RepID=UPI00027AEE32|nr:hypothetical protein [Methylocystis sp. SC2]CCJ06386.1 Uncharacterized protein BN69_0935 [Methylocystis sp. SC2]
MKRIAVWIASFLMTQQILLAEAIARPARCVIASNGAPAYNGACDFSAEDRGSFSITPAGKRAFNGATVVSVFVTSPGVAEVRGLTRDGINSRWGEAKRSKTDPACWVGDDFKICVY